MLRRASGFIRAETLALTSALSIVAILFYAHHANQASWHDQEAKLLAQKVRPAVEALFIKNPQANLSLEGLKEMGLLTPEGLQVKVTPFKDLRGDWQVEVWHPQGQRIYLVSAQGLSDRTF